jgi:hypothetical protein
MTPYHLLHPKNRKRIANEFLVWRVGRNAKWKLTAEEIAVEINLHVKTVRDICRDKGWKLQEPLETAWDRSDRNIIPVDMAMKGLR